MCVKRVFNCRDKRDFVSGGAAAGVAGMFYIVIF
jgi:hypothetical protein